MLSLTWTLLALCCCNRKKQRCELSGEKEVKQPELIEFSVCGGERTDRLWCVLWGGNKPWVRRLRNGPTGREPLGGP